MSLSMEMQRQSTKNLELQNSLELKILAAMQFGILTSVASKESLDDYVKKCLEIERPQESPRVFVCSSESDFNDLLTQIQTWEVAQNKLILPKIQTIKPGNEALRDTFFYDPDLGYFQPSKYFVLINPNQQVIQQIESGASQTSNQAVNFDEQSKVDILPNAIDPFDLQQIDTSSRNQVFVGDKIMYPYDNDNGEIIIKLAKINY